MDEEKLASEITGCEDCHIQRQVMNWAFKQECSDCKYYNSGECTHPHYSIVSIVSYGHQNGMIVSIMIDNQDVVNY